MFDYNNIIFNSFITRSTAKAEYRLICIIVYTHRYTRHMKTEGYNTQITTRTTYTNISDRILLMHSVKKNLGRLNIKKAYSTSFLILLACNFLVVKRSGFHVSRKFGVLNKLKWWEENWSEAIHVFVEACLVL